MYLFLGLGAGGNGGGAVAFSYNAFTSSDPDTSLGLGVATGPDGWLAEGVVSVGGTPSVWAVPSGWVPPSELGAISSSCMVFIIDIKFLESLIYILQRVSYRKV